MTNAAKGASPSIQQVAAVGSAATASASPREDDERSLLIRLELLLEREEESLATGVAAELAAIAEQREQLIERLGQAARLRHATSSRATADNVELVALYQRMRHRHDVQAQVMRRHAERNARAIGVLAQATGQSNLYQADGRVAMQFVAV